MMIDTDKLIEALENQIGPDPQNLTGYSWITGRIAGIKHAINIVRVVEVQTKADHAGAVAAGTAPPEFACMESMTTIEHEGWVIRVWRDEADSPPGSWNNSDLRIAAKSIATGSGSGIGELRIERMNGIAKHIARLTRVNAVEVKDATGCGVVVYTTWP